MTYEFNPRKLKRLDSIRALCAGKYLITLLSADGEVLKLICHVIYKESHGGKDLVKFDTNEFGREMMNGHVDTKEVIGAVLAFHRNAALGKL